MTQPAPAREPGAAAKASGPGAAATALESDLHYAELAEAFVARTAGEVDDGIGAALRRIAAFLEVDVAALLEAEGDGDVLRLTHSWGASPLSSDARLDRLPWTLARARAGEVVAVSSPAELPAEAASDRAALAELGVRAHLAAPLVAGGALLGLALLGTRRDRCGWPPRAIERARALAVLLSAALARRRAERRLREALRFERLLRDASATFVNLPASEVDGAITDALRRIVEFLDLDRSAIAQPSPDRRMLVVTHCYARPGCPSMAGVSSVQMPWIDAQIRAGNAICWPRVPDDIPPEAALERDFHTRDGLKSHLGLPLVAGGAVVGMIGFGSLRSARAWPGELIERLRSIAQVFADALARKESDERLRRAFTEIEDLKNRLAAENLYLRDEVRLDHPHAGIVGGSPAIRKVLSRIEQVAQTNATVLLLGETGTGKELLARAIHELCPRRERPMIKVNCAALPSSLVENELFGREKGAYTGALSRQIGRFELADRSTLFLDEIGELPLELQAKLLRVLQDGEFERLGSAKTIRVDVRIVAATNRDLGAAVREKTFREDLFYRLNVFPVAVPPLRERREDIPLLVWEFVKELGRSMGHRIETVPRRAMEQLQAYDWPGNVRELRNVIERAMILSRGDTLLVELPSDPGPARAPRATLEEVERRHIQQVLAATGGRIRGPGGAAEILGLKPTTLESRLQKLGVERPGRRG